MAVQSTAEESVKEAEQPRIRPGVWALCVSTDPARHKHEERAALSRGSGVHSKLMSRKTSDYRLKEDSSKSKVG